MEPCSYDFAIIGGDKRQNYMEQLLEKRGYRVCTYALKDAQRQSAQSLKCAVEKSQAIIAPVPMSKDGVEINSFVKKDDLGLPDLLQHIREEHVIFGGCIPSEFQKEAAGKGAYTYDFMEDEELAIYNSIATAEGAVAEAIKRSSLNLHKSKCLVLGYGKCGRTIAAYLKGMFCHVTVYARKSAARALAGLTADETKDFGAIADGLEQFSFIFNTVPSKVLDNKALESVGAPSVIIDVASAPGGLDYDAAEKLGVQAFLCPGLPGKYAPESSARALTEIVIRQMQNA